MSSSETKTPLAKDGPGARTVQPQHVLARLNRDLDDRRGERRLDDPAERAHGYIRSDAAVPERAEARTMKRAERILRTSQPENLSKVDKPKWEAEYRRLGSWMAERMITRKAVSLTHPHDPEYQRAKRMMASMEMSAEFVRVAERWKNLARSLWPDQPEMSNIERIRPN